MVRVLITVYPLMYREALAAALRQARPDALVVSAAPEETRGKVERFRPHLLVHADSDDAPPEALEAVPCVVEVLYNDSMDVRIGVGKNSREMADAGIGALLEALDQATASPSSTNGSGG